VDARDAELMSEVKELRAFAADAPAERAAATEAAVARYGLTDNACHVIIHIVDPRFWS